MAKKVLCLALFCSNEIEKGLITDKMIAQNYANYFKPLEIEPDKKMFYTIGDEGLNLEQYLNQWHLDEMNVKINGEVFILRLPLSFSNDLLKARSKFITPSAYRFMT